MIEEIDKMGKKIGRNDKCPCGSGKKYKYCCMNKMSIEELENLYMEQYYLTKGLKEEDACNKILELGERILSSNFESPCITGTYVNMAVAKRILYYIKGQPENLLQAQNYCYESLKLKHNNQAAIAQCFGICLELRKYKEAKDILELYDKDEKLKNPLSVQVVAEYQAAIGRASNEEYNKEIKTVLDKITNVLFEKFGKNAGLCAVVMMYYMGIGNDVLEAYELGKKSIESFPSYQVYSNLGWICTQQQINKPNDAVNYFAEAIKLCDDKNVCRRIQGNYMIALAENGELQEAIALGQRLIKEDPCNQNYSNYAELLKRQGNLEDALEWGRKALFIIEDDTTLLVVADIYRRLCDYENAEEMYEKCIEHINKKDNTYRFQDADGVALYSIASDNNMNDILYEALGGLIQVYNSQKKYELARTYATVAKEKLPGKNDWEIWLKVLPEIENKTQLYETVKQKLEQSLNENKNQKTSFRLWAQQLIQLQDTVNGLDLDDNDEWGRYEEKMNEILAEMSKLINKESTVYQQKLAWINTNFPSLDLDAKCFLVTAEVLFELHKSSTIDFAPIIVEYSKVVEKQLRVKLGAQIPSNRHMLGEIIGCISGNHIAPYDAYVTDLRVVNNMRKRSAHTGTLIKTDVDNMRNIFYQNNLLLNLM